MPKTRRRGSILKLGPDRYRVALSYDREGKRKVHYKTIKGPKKDAERYLTHVTGELDGGRRSFDSPPMTLNEFFGRWLESPSRARGSDLTSYGHARLYDRYFRERLGHRKLDRLHVLDIQKVYAEMLGRGLSATTVRHAHSVINCALKQAVRWGLLQRNPAELAELPKAMRKERRVLSPEEARRFISACGEMPRGIVFEFALLTGMRPEEYLALQWADLDFERCAARVRRAVVWQKGGWRFKEPKTARSRRTVVLSADLVQKLAAHKREQNEWRLKLGGEWQAHDLVFCGETGTPLSIPNLTYRYFRPILKKAGLPQIRLYDLRHSCATLLLIAEENPKVVSERLGHSTIVLTLDTYSHVLPTMQEQATSRLEKLLYKVGS
jgi:integrase